MRRPLGRETVANKTEPVLARPSGCAQLFLLCALIMNHAFPGYKVLVIARSAFYVKFVSCHGASDSVILVS